MPSVSIWMIRSSLVWFLLTFLTGSLLLLNKGFEISPALWALMPVHYEMALLGWILQFVLGTAYWMFPRHLEGPKRGNRKSAILMVITLNAGIVFSAFAMNQEWVLFAGRFFLLSGVILFVRLMWGRVVSYRDL